MQKFTAQEVGITSKEMHNLQYDKFHPALEQSGAKVVGTDVMDLTREDVAHIDVVLMNPPFSGAQDIKHVEHVLSIVPEHTEIHAIMSMSVKERSGGLYGQFRDFLDSMGIEIEELENGSFKESGTMVRSCVVRIPARSSAQDRAA